MSSRWNIKSHLAWKKKGRFRVLLNVFWSIKSTDAAVCSRGAKGSWWESLSLPDTWGGREGGREAGFQGGGELALGGPPLGGPYNSFSQLQQITILATSKAQRTTFRDKWVAETSVFVIIISTSHVSCRISRFRSTPATLLSSSRISSYCNRCCHCRPQ